MKGQLHLNLMADDELRAAILDMIRSELRAIVREKRDELLEKMLPAAVAQVITLDNLVNKLFSAWSYNDANAKLRRQVTDAVDAAAREAKEAARERVKQLSATDLAVLVDQRLRMSIENSEYLLKLIKDAVKAVLGGPGR